MAATQGVNELTFEEDDEEAFYTKDLPAHACRFVLGFLKLILWCIVLVYDFIHFPAIVESTIPVVLCCAIQLRSGFAMVEATPLAGQLS